MTTTKSILQQGIQKPISLPTKPTQTKNVRFLPPTSPRSNPASRPSTVQMMEMARPRVLGIHHLKFAVSNIDISIAWYERVIGAQRIPSLDHLRADGTRFAAILEVTDWSGHFLELRKTSIQQATRDRGWDPVTLTVKGKEDLVRWINWLDRWGTTHSPLLTGPRGWILIFEDPDGRRIRLYTQDDHGGREPVSTNEYWLSEPQ